MPIDNLSKITSRTGISTTILLEAGNVNATGIITAAGFNGPFTGGGAIAAGIITGTGLEISGISTLGIITASGNVSIGGTLDLSISQVGFDNPSQIKLSDLVIGQHQNTGSYKIENGSTGSLLLRADMINFATSNGGTSLLRSSTSEVQIFAGNTARLVTNGIGATVFGELDVTGDVGIGTTNPSRRLHVADYGAHGVIRVEGSGNTNRSGIEFYRETSAGVSKGGAAIWVESDTSTSAGKLRFGTASNAGVQSQNTDMILDHQGRLGIGTTNPQQKLQVMGTVVKTRSDSAVGLIYLTNDGSQNGNILVNDSSGVTRVKLDSADVSYIRGGNLGIGSMTPGRALTIQNSEPRIRLQKPNQGHGEIYIDDDNSINLSADSSSSVGTSSIIFRTNGAENVRIKEDKVGVGLSNPTETLTIDGSATDTTSILGLRSGNNHNTISNGAQIAFGHAGVNHYQHFIHTRHNGSNSHNAIDFYVCDGTQANSVTSGSIHTMSIVSGRVGIGSTNPVTQLDVRGNINFHNNMIISNFDSNGVGGNNIDHIWHSDAQTPQAGGTWNFVSDGTAKQVGNSVIQAGYLKTSSGGSLLGKVGIGTTDPGGNLTVAADSASAIIELKRTNSNGGTGAYGAVNWTALDGHSVASVFALGDGDNEGAHLIFKNTSASASNDPYNAATVERLRIKSTGEVGIGTNDPQSFLSLHQSGGGFEVNANSGSNNARLLSYDRQASAYREMTFQALSYGFETSGAEKVRITSGGDVGVGNDSPNCRLAVKDTATHTAYANLTPSVGDCMLQLYNNPSSEAVNNHSTLQFGVYGGSHNRVNTISAVAENAGNRKMATTFCTDSGANRNERMRITGDGLVGIGTTGPTQVLHILDANPIIQFTDTNGLGARINADSGNIHLDTHNANRDVIIRGGNSTADEVVRVTGDGMVGIGTKAPAVRLDVRNDSGTNADTEPLVALHHSEHDVDGEVLRIGRTDLPTIRYHRLFSEHSGTASSNTLKFYMHSGTAGGSATATRQVLTLQGNGRVGIGTTNGGLDAALEVCSDEGAYIKSFTNATPAKVRFSDNASSGSYDQFMTVDYRHANNAVVDGTSEGLHIFGSESTTAVRIDGLLRITEQPCAVVYQASGPAGGDINAESDNAEPIHFDHVHINQGGMAIANDNARITVPVPGNYLVSGMISGTVSSPNADDGIELIFLVDGSEYPASNSRMEPVDNFGATANQSEYAFINTTILTLAKNDYVELAVHSVGSSNAAVSRGHLSVALLN